MSAVQTVIRPALSSDATAVAQINASGWLNHYGGLMPQTLLARVAPKPDKWAEAIEQAAGPGHFAVAERANGVVGFGTLIAQRDTELRNDGYDGEIAALYVSTPLQRTGIGRALIQHLLGTAQSARWGGVSVFTLTGSTQSCGFYRGLGGVEIARRTAVRDGEPMRETAFGWRLAQPLHD